MDELEGFGDDHSSPAEGAPRAPLHRSEEETGGHPRLSRGRRRPQSPSSPSVPASSESLSSSSSSSLTFRNSRQNRDSGMDTGEAATSERLSRGVSGGVSGGAAGGVAGVSAGGAEVNESNKAKYERFNARTERISVPEDSKCLPKDLNAAEEMAGGKKAEKEGGRRTTPAAGEAVAVGPSKSWSILRTSTLGSTHVPRKRGSVTTTTRRLTTSDGRIDRKHFVRYSMGEYVLVSREICDAGEFDNDGLLNRFGYPPPRPGLVGSMTPEERAGPHVYVLAVVVGVHFGEDAQYYTVRREDTMQEQRADAEWMEPITTLSSLNAAKAAARKRHSGSSRVVAAMMRAGGGRGADVAGRLSMRGKRMIQTAKAQTEAFLNGKRPYGISCRFTGVNFLVICSIWYLYIDQLRLAFMPSSADYPCAVISAIVFLVLFMELIVEVFIRPRGYHALIRSEKAYLPSTVRYLDRFHLVTEMISLIFFAPEFLLLFGYTDPAFDLSNACLMSIYGPSRLKAFYGTAYICMLRLRIFGVVRHWTKMWINNTIVRVRGANGEWQVQRAKGLFAPQWRREAGNGQEIAVATGEARSHPINYDDQNERNVADKKNLFTNDYHLTNASRIGTALFNTNATRALIFVFLIGLIPLFSVVLEPDGDTNQDNHNSAVLLNAYNLALNSTDNETCALLKETIEDWKKTYAFESSIYGDKTAKHLWCVDVLPKRCEFQSIYNCTKRLTEAESFCTGRCNNNTGLCSRDQCRYFRPSTLFFESVVHHGTNFAVQVVYNEFTSVNLTMIYILSLNLTMTLGVLLFLSMLRNDAGRLVLGPLRRMLKIVAFYAKNPLSPPPRRESVNCSMSKHEDAYFYDSDDETSDEKLGTFETEQLVNAVTKITDLLRKCWGVAGAGIISSNLATNESGLSAYFNPTVPGKAVYALFAFVYIDRFNFHLHALKGDIMILINDIAAVLHEECYRWGYEDSGQCNKNLGNAFLMVYKIGAVNEVMEKRVRAEAVIFSTKDIAKYRRRKDSIIHRSRSGSDQSDIRSRTGRDRSTHSSVDNIDLSSLPGIRCFSDRALLGLLKTFAGIHRDKTILSWNNDFRLGAGVGAMSINLLFGMDAGWAVEGAVGSMYKIDATYLSPHVNMASRMMSATKQYRLHFLLSQAVHKLLSETAQSKLRHVDTVTVKGSSVQQKIFTYDARVRTDFFLYGKSKSQDDADSDRYTPEIWNVDQDLVAMRNHICDEFTEMFNRGREEYLSGNWPTAIKLLKSANNIMVEQVVKEGYWGSKNLIHLSDDDEVEERHLGDGPSQRLITYMEELGGEAPKDWGGYRKLTSK